MTKRYVFRIPDLTGETETLAFNASSEDDAWDQLGNAPITDEQFDDAELIDVQ